jgi:imidazolonepropionase-like amidohydrolase
MKYATIFTSLSLFAIQAVAAPQTWLTNVQLVSPEKLDRIETGSVLIDGERIVRVERGANRKTPSGRAASMAMAITSHPA